MWTIDTSQFEQTEALRWVTAYANHVANRFNSRAVISLRRDGETIRLSHVFALQGGGIVLVEDGGHDHEHGEAGHEHEHEHGDPEHGEAGRPHEHGAAGGPARARGYECPRELWFGSPDELVLEACDAPDGEWSTGFGYLGRSRTPHVLVARGTEPPPRRDHDH